MKHLKKTLLLLEAYEEESKQASLIKTYEEDNQTNPKKNSGRPLGSNNNKKNPIAIMLSRNAMCLQKREKLL